MTAMYYQDILCSLDSVEKNYHLVDGIWRNGKVYSDLQEQTRETFAFKWDKRETYESTVSSSATRKWHVEKYFDGDNNGTKILKKGGERLRCRMRCGFCGASAFRGNVERCKLSWRGYIQCG